MNPDTNKRRTLLKAGLAAPLMGGLTLKNTLAHAATGNRFLVPDAIQQELFTLYGAEANLILPAEHIQLKAPAIAENGAVVTMSVTGERDLVSTMAVFVEKNHRSLATTCKLHQGSDLDIAFRIKVWKTSDVYLIAQTSQGLVGLKKNVKITIGCGGG